MFDTCENENCQGERNAPAERVEFQQWNSSVPGEAVLCQTCADELEII